MQDFLRFIKLHKSQNAIYKNPISNSYQKFHQTKLILHYLLS